MTVWAKLVQFPYLSLVSCHLRGIVCLKRNTYMQLQVTARLYNLLTSLLVLPLKLISFQTQAEIILAKGTLPKIYWLFGLNLLLKIPVRRVLRLVISNACDGTDGFNVFREVLMYIHEWLISLLWVWTVRNDPGVSDNAVKLKC